MAVADRKPDSAPTGAISTTLSVRRASWNVMEPRIQYVQTPWMSGFMTAIAAPGQDWCG